MFGLLEELQRKLDEKDYSVDKDTLEDAVKTLRFYEKRIRSLEAMNKCLLMREKSMWSLEEVAKYLDVSNQTVYNMIRDKRIKAYKIGREWRFHSMDVQEYVVTMCNVREVQNG